MSGPFSGASYEYDASIAASITGSPNVTAWADQSGNARDLNAVVGTPQTGVGNINGLNAISFAGGSQLLYRLSVVITAPRTFFGVVKSNVTNSPGAELKWVNHGAGGAGLINTTWCGDSGSTNMTGGTVDTNPHVIAYVDNGTSGSLWFDGSKIATGGSGASGSTADIEIGGDGGSQGWNGLIGFVTGFPSAFTDADIVTEMSYLGGIWTPSAPPIVVHTPRFWTPQGFNRELGTPFALRGVDVSSLTTNQSLDVVSTQTPTLTKVANYARTLTVTSTGAATLTKILSALRTLTVTSTGTATLTRIVSYLRTLTVTSTQTATLVASRAFLKTLTVTETATATMSRQVGKILSATSTGTATLTRIVAYLRTLSVTSTGTATLTKTIARLRTLAVTSTQTPTIIRQVGKTLAATSVGTATLTKIAAYGRTLSVVSTGTATFIRTIGKTLGLTSTQTPDLTPIKSGGTTTPQAISATSTQTAEILLETIPAGRGGIRPGQQFIESRDYLRERRERDELERLNQEALALLLLTS